MPRFEPGNRLGGRPRGARNKLAKRFFEDMSEVWDEPIADGKSTRGKAAVSWKPKKGFNCVSCGTRPGGRAGACHSPKREPRPIPKGRCLGNPHARGMGRLLEGSVSEHKGAPEVAPG